MAEDRKSWMLRKAAIALPIVLVLALARCSGGAGEGNQQGEGTSESQTTAETQQSEQGTSDQQAKESAGEGQPDQKMDGDSAEQASDNGAPTEYTAEQIKAAMRKHIARRTRLGNPGVFEITDPRTSQTLQLRFQKIHDPVRTLAGNFYFACTNFSVIGQPDKTFDLDFWLQPQKGELVVYQENVHKVPVRKDGEWVQKPHYNFVDDRINLLP